MKFPESNSPSRGLFEGLLVLVVALAALSSSMTPSARAGGAGTGTGTGAPTGRPTVPNTGADMNYDEGIGSLPIQQAPTPYTPITDLVPPEFLGPNGLVRPYVDLRGTLVALKRAIVDATGTGVITLHPPALPDGRWAVGFHGDVDIDLDSYELQNRDVEVSIRVGGEFEGGVAAASWNGLTTPIVVLDEPMLQLPMSQMLGSGFFAQNNNVGLLAMSSFQTVAQLEIVLMPNRILRISQRID